MGIYLGRAIQNNKNIKDLDLRWNKLGINGVKVLAESIEYNNQLVSMDLIGNNGGEENLATIDQALD